MRTRSLSDTSSCPSRGHAQREPANGEQLGEVEALRRECQMLRQQLEDERRLRAEQTSGVAESAAASSQPATATLHGTGAPAAVTSEGRLRAALTGAVDSTELAHAIDGVEAMLAEARRELAAVRLRERRAAFERLHEALRGSEEGRLAEALEAARRADVEQEDVEMAEAKLQELRSLTEEQVVARAASEREVGQKKSAYLLVKKDDADALVALLSSVEAKARWQGWRDYQGRSLLRYAQDMRCARATMALQQLLPEAAPRRAVPHRTLREGEAEPGKVSLLVGLFQGGGAAPQKPDGARADGSHSPGTDAHASASGAAASAPEQAHVTPERRQQALYVPSGPSSPQPSSPGSPGSPQSTEERLKKVAFRAVVQEDVPALIEVLNQVPAEAVARWRNRAGKDLLTLSEERGSQLAYSVLAKAFGLLREQKREAFEERQAVWVYLQGEVQPRRATVLEDTPAEADEVLVEYWDGAAEDEPVRLDRSMVLRMCA